MDEDDISNNDDRMYLGSRLREWRHNPCLMQPISLIMLLLFGSFMLITLLIQAPTLLLGLVLSPILSRSSWYVEFLYPWDIARSAHFFLIQQTSHQKKTKSDDKNRGFHSRTLEQRIEVVPDRIYIHPIPQLLDNLGYLIVCLPEKKAQRQNHENVRITLEDISHDDPIVALMVDCGEASATIRAVEMIQNHHYKHQKIDIHAILSTHKHHDHTAGNYELLKHKLGRHVSNVYGGKVEKIPRCTDFLVDGDFIQLPRSGSNDMNEIVEMEAIAVPAHTRGSMVYRLACKWTSQPDFMFTGDTMFSAGAGVPFESDTGAETDSQINRSHGNTFIRAGRGLYAMERCFAEILARGKPNAGHDKSVADKILIFPGHEYTSELLSRQFAGAVNESCRWKNFLPSDFFDTVSHMYVALHRRTLPHNSGKLLLVPSPISRELHINPQFRSMRRSGELVIRAIKFWYEYFYSGENGATATDETPSDEDNNGKHGYLNERMKQNGSTTRSWNVNSDHIGDSVFTTLYKNDFDALIEDLTSGTISTKEAAQRLRDSKMRLHEPVVNKRAIPGYLPSNKGMFKGVKGLVLLGSRPSAMTLTDSRAMKLPPPIDSNSDRIMISHHRLRTVLGRLGLFDNESRNVVAMIHQLWKEASQFASGEDSGNADVESFEVDEIELGILKWVLYGVPSNQPSWFSKIFCMPCSRVPPARDFPMHPASNMEQKSGELVSHDVFTCHLCRSAAGCPLMQNRGESGVNEKRRSSAEGDHNDHQTDEHGQETCLEESVDPTSSDEFEMFPSDEVQVYDSTMNEEVESCDSIAMVDGVQSIVKEHE